MLLPLSGIIWIIGAPGRSTAHRLRPMSTAYCEYVVMSWVRPESRMPRRFTAVTGSTSPSTQTHPGTAGRVAPITLARM